MKREVKLTYFYLLRWFSNRSSTYNKQIIKDQYPRVSEAIRAVRNSKYPIITSPEQAIYFMKPYLSE